MSKRTDVTNILKRASEGDESAVNRLLPLVYDELARWPRATYSANGPT